MLRSTRPQGERISRNSAKQVRATKAHPTSITQASSREKVRKDLIVLGNGFRLRNSLVNSLTPSRAWK